MVASGAAVRGRREKVRKPVMPGLPPRSIRIAPDANVAYLVDDEGNPIIYDQTSDSGGIVVA